MLDLCLRATAYGGCAHSGAEAPALPVSTKPRRKTSHHPRNNLPTTYITILICPIDTTSSHTLSIYSARLQKAQYLRRQTELLFETPILARLSRRFFFLLCIIRPAFSETKKHPTGVLGASSGRGYRTAYTYLIFHQRGVRGVG